MKRKNIKSKDMKLAIILLSQLALNNMIIDNPNIANDSKLKQQDYGENRIIRRVLHMLCNGINESTFNEALKNLDKYSHAIDDLEKIQYDEILTSNYRYKCSEVVK
jgi:hypothetical protein